ncbi:MAG: thiamine diphosphokinase [Ignavibacteriales bacterium]|nr:MAG: thiamine diphosphokinase [Ignavibacteriales bacterium]
MKKCIILANGTPPDKKLISFLARKKYNDIICADGGANSARKLGIIPNYIIGDFDSITETNLNYFSDKSEVIRIKRQNDTDVEKAIKLAIKKGYKDCLLLGAIGNRLDHSICNLSIILKFAEKIRIRIIYEKSMLSVESGEINLTTKPGEVISLFAFDSRTKIFSKGLRYELRNTSLPFGSKEGESNNSKGKSVSLKIKNGKIFLIRLFDIAKNNGFI